LRVQQPSSYPNYLGQISQAWVKPNEILSFFKSAQAKNPKSILSYQSFVEGSKREELETIGKLTLE